MIVKAVGPWHTNASLIADGCVPLLYLHEDWSTLDPTYHEGRFWTRFRPHSLRAHDIVPERAPDGPMDFRSLDYQDETFVSVVADPPYQLNGTSSGKGPAAKDVDYGTDGDHPTSWQVVHQLIRDGITEWERVLRPAERERVDRQRWEWRGGTLLVKCQDQVCGGAVRWQTREFADHAESLGLVLEDQLHLLGHRAQPVRTRRHGDCGGLGCGACDQGRVPSRQEHAARNYSTMLVFRKRP